MFDHHRKSPWFAEKYDPAPEFESLRTRVRKEGWKGRLNAFLHDLESGKFDPDLNDSEVEPSSPVKENGNGDASHADGASEDPKPHDDDMQFNGDVDEEGADNELSRADVNGKSSGDKNRGTRGEEVSVPPEGNQVMIRTIPPDIGRVKLEEVSFKSQYSFVLFSTYFECKTCSKVPGYIYLALGDPLQKRNYYRAGWLRFKDDANMTAVVAELLEKKVNIHFT